MDIVSHRRALHRIPELELELPKTMAYLRGALQGMNCHVFAPMDNALCAWFDFGREEAIAFRADCDALAITEATGAEYASTHPGWMHACGHDGHMAILLELARRMVRSDVLEEPLELGPLCGMTAEELRTRSHRPQEFYSQGHFMPAVTDGAAVLRLNRLRTMVRGVERLALPAFPQGRADLLRALNRMSSLVYIWMIREKAKRSGRK